MRALLIAAAMFSAALPAHAANRVKDNLQWGMLTREGKEAMRSRNYADAERKLKQAMQVASSFDDEDPKGVAIAKENLAEVYLAQKMWAKAETHLLDAIYLRERQEDVDDLEIAAKLDELGKFFVTSGRPGKAEAWFQKSVDRLDAARDPDYHVKGATLLELANTQLANKKLAPAIASFIRSREEYAKSPAGTGELEDQRFLARSLSGQATALAASGKSADAKTFHLKAVAVADKNFPGDAFLAEILEAAARDLKKIDVTQAGKLEIRAKEIRRNSFE